MHPQIHQDSPGSCPICHMDLIAVKAAPIPAATATQYTCPMHPQVLSATPGSCPICHMDLVPKSAAPAGAGAGELTLTAQQVQLANIRTQTIGPAPASPTAPAAPSVLTGTVVADARRTTTVSSRVAGRVEKLFVRQTGQVLRQGTPLFSVYSEQLQMLQQQYVLALAQSRAAGGTYQQFAEATAQKLRLLGVTAAQLRRLAARGTAPPLVTYYSPGTGTVQTLRVVQGQYVAEGSPLLTLTDLGTVWVEAQLYPADATRLPVGRPVAVQVAGEAQPRRGKVIFLSPELSGTSQITLARIELANPDGRLQPGSQANVLLAPAAPTAPGAPAGLVVPPAAVLHEGAASYVWAQTGERQFRRVRVRTGAATAAAVPILAGLEPGARVVTTGAYLLQSEWTLRQGSAETMNGVPL
ncbi:efflux RND transporter periplasmic adaptor subunit [Hymenobacter rubripertinctus]|uniref:Efflux RND transporter periplasmic adaptor subunit n=2 Tax=Hymenobacter rubripertinctus TaxID=2029981 RepID=A0A418QVR6_9BACT|nr:efflux RND transporter periplasmic adaptor subunit [Hymenobacter rubripertinctus]